MKKSIRAIAGKTVSYAETDGAEVSIHFTDGSSVNMEADDIVVEEPDVLCNMCGLTCMLGDPELRDKGGLIKADVTGGYSSTAGNGEGALDDGDRYTFSLCEFCLDHIFSNFKIPVEAGSYMYSDDEARVFCPASERVAEDFWRKGKEKFFAEFNRRNEARKVK
jgi:hypothetical protein